MTRNALAARNNEAQGLGNWELRRGLQITQTTSKTVQWGKPRRWSTSSSVVTSLITTYHKYHWPQAHKRDPSLEAASGSIVYWRPTPDFTVNTLRTTTVVISTTLDYPYQRTKRMKCSPQTHANSEERIHQQLNKQSKWSFLLFYQKTVTTHTNEASLNDATLFHTLNNLVLLFWNLSRNMLHWPTMETTNLFSISENISWSPGSCVPQTRWQTKQAFHTHKQPRKIETYRTSYLNRV